MQPNLPACASASAHSSFKHQNPFKTREIKKTGNPKFIQLSFLIIIVLFSIISAKAQDILVGLTADGGVEGKGTAYSIKTNGTAFNVIKGFADWGSYPVSNLVKGQDGSFYGMTPQGGTYNYGTIFKITSSGQITIIKHFDLKADGGAPKGSLIIGKDGSFYG